MIVSPAPVEPSASEDLTIETDGLWVRVTVRSLLALTGPALVEPSTVPVLLIEPASTSARLTV